MSSLIQPQIFEELKPNGVANKLSHEDRCIHDWYRFVLSFPPHLVRTYLNKFGLKNDSTVLDPFCGTGTTIVEANLLGINGCGIEANKMAYFASLVKTTWDVSADSLLNDSVSIADNLNKTSRYNIRDLNSTQLIKLPDDKDSLLLKGSISPIPLHKVLLLLNEINKNSGETRNHQLLALAKVVVSPISNLHFGPEVGVKRHKIADAPVVDVWIAEIRKIAHDLNTVKSLKCGNAVIYEGDARCIGTFIAPESIDAVFTSPPYPNEKDYTRTTRLESVLLNFIGNKEELRSMKKTLLRSNTRGVYKGDNDDEWISWNSQILGIAKEIEDRRIFLGKTSGFEKLYHKVTKLYFGGMAKHLSELRPYLKRGAMLGYVVGDQASYLQVHIPTGKILGDIAVNLGYEVSSIDLFRTRLSTATKKQMAEEVVVLRWPGF